MVVEFYEIKFIKSFLLQTYHRQAVKFFTGSLLSLSLSFPLSLSLSLSTYFRQGNRKVQIMKAAKAGLHILDIGNERRTRSKSEIDGADGRDRTRSEETKGKKKNGE